MKFFTVFGFASLVLLFSSSVFAVCVQGDNNNIYIRNGESDYPRNFYGRENCYEKYYEIQPKISTYYSRNYPIYRTKVLMPGGNTGSCCGDYYQKPFTVSSFSDQLNANYYRAPSEYDANERLRAIYTPKQYRSCDSIAPYSYEFMPTNNSYTIHKVVTY